MTEEQPKFKRGDIVEHVLTGEKMMVENSRKNNWNEETIYEVMLQNYSMNFFPEWQLKKNEEEGGEIDKKRQMEKYIAICDYLEKRDGVFY